jgi:hypothetical protein
MSADGAIKDSHKDPTTASAISASAMDLKRCGLVQRSRRKESHVCFAGRGRRAVCRVEMRIITDGSEVRAISERILCEGFGW